MSQTDHILAALKRALKAKGLTYIEVADCLDLSEASVKRLFSDRNFTLERLEKVCELLNMNILDLIQNSEQQKMSVSSLSKEQEQDLVADIKLLLMAHSLMNKWTFDEVVATFSISETEGIQLLAALDRMKIIELLPSNRVILLISRDFSWLPRGPIECFFENQIQQDFFNSRFDTKGEHREFISGMLSEASVYEVNKKIKKFVVEFNDLVRKDETLPLNERYGTSLFMASRLWEIKAFAALRRVPSTKKL